MREYKASNGERRVWYDPHEIEAMMVDKLTQAGLLPRCDQEDLSVDVEKFVELSLGLPLDQHADLDATVLGVTDFVPGKTPKISINRDLTGSALDDEDATPGLVGRWRATVAHETCHVLLHRLLFEIDDRQRSLFVSSECAAAPQRLLRCLKRDVGFGRHVSDWKEVQANIGMGALLMPKPVFLAAIDEGRVFLGVADRPIASGSAMHEKLTAILAPRFTVSKQAARIRLESLGIVHPADQPTL